MTTHIIKYFKRKSTVRSNRKMPRLKREAQTLKMYWCALTVCVTRWWAGRENAILPEPASSHENGLKTHRLPPVGCIIPMHLRDAVLGAFWNCQISLQTTNSKTGMFFNLALKYFEYSHQEFFFYFLPILATH